MTRDARLSALHRGGFGLSGSRASLPASPALAEASADPDRLQRAPRVQVLVPGGRGPYLPGRTVASRCRRTPHLAPSSGSPPETPLNERGCEQPSLASVSSQESSWTVGTAGCPARSEVPDRKGKFAMKNFFWTRVTRIFQKGVFTEIASGWSLEVGITTESVSGPRMLIVNPHQNRPLAALTMM
jgi:hypothetical protein